MRAHVYEVSSCQWILAQRARRDAEVLADELCSVRRLVLGWLLLAAAAGAVILGVVK